MYKRIMNSLNIKIILIFYFTLLLSIRISYGNGYDRFDILLVVSIILLSLSSEFRDIRISSFIHLKK